jgi:hypothetical protein
VARKLTADQLDAGTAAFTAEELAETTASFVDRLRSTAAAETRTEMAAALRALATGSEKQLTGHMEKDVRPVTDDLRAGLALAAELLADLENYDG